MKNNCECDGKKLSANEIMEFADSLVNNFEKQLNSIGFMFEKNKTCNNEVLLIVFDYISEICRRFVDNTLRSGMVNKPEMMHILLSAVCHACGVELRLDFVNEFSKEIH